MEDRFKYKLLNIKTNKFIDMFNKNRFVLRSDGSLEYIYRGLCFDKPDIKDLKPIFCTGLKDKNEKLIFEGDIVKMNSCYKKNSLFIIKFGVYALSNTTSDLYGYYLENIKSKKTFPFYNFYKKYDFNLCVDSNRITIIGNKFEDTDLLKK